VKKNKKKVSKSIESEVKDKKEFIFLIKKNIFHLLVIAFAILLIFYSNIDIFKALKELIIYFWGPL
tara:strand:+ start:43 stop:240 length:198 start_codon:yes stop_codon:yes gene_type:complete